MLDNIEILDLEQGTPEWIALRKTKITATDASVIMGVNPWKNISQLYEEKVLDVNPLYMNEKMKRGIELEPIARQSFILETGIVIHPKIVVKGWAMASLDGMNEDANVIVEIKCPSDKDHKLAISGKIPDYYYPQLQHQMYVTGLQFNYYYSFDGIDGVVVKVERDEEYIQKMLIEEEKFYECIMSKTPPKTPEDSYIERSDELWNIYANQWKEVTQQMKDLEKLEKELRNEIIYLSGELNSKGAGISLCQIQRKGNVDYSKIPELKNVNLDDYRKDSINTWRISCL